MLVVCAKDLVQENDGMSNIPLSQRKKMNAEQMAAFLGIPPSSSDGPKIIQSIKPEDWEQYEHMAWVVDELNAGRIPANVIACEDHEDTVH